MRRSLSIFALLFAASQGPLAAQSTPEAVAQAYANAIKASDWAGAARVMHPDALKQLRGIFAEENSSSALDEREQVGVDDVGLCRDHAVRVVLECLQRGVFEELG